MLAFKASMRLMTRGALASSPIGLDRLAGLLVLEQLDQRLLVVILEGLGIEVAGLGIHDVGRELHHLRRQLQIRDILEIIGLTRAIS